MQPPLPPKVWYKTKTGIIFLSILALLGIGGIGFAGLTGYYVVKIQKGEGKELAAIFNDEFTKGAGLSGETKGARLDPATIIRKHNPTLGASKSPITIIAFIDFECPFCQKEYSVFEQVIDTYGSAIRVIFKHFPLSSIHPNANASALAAACAEEQNKFWEYYDILFKTKLLDQTSLFSHATTLNLNKSSFQTCLASERYAANVTEDLNDGISAGVRGTPTYFLNGRKIEGAITFEKWGETILAELNN